MCDSVSERFFKPNPTTWMGGKLQRKEASEKEDAATMFVKLRSTRYFPMFGGSGGRKVG